MTTTTEPQKTDDRADDYWGLCPDCKSAPTMINVGKANWAHCPKCKTRWAIGTGMFGSNRHETEDDWKRNDEVLRGCREVEPFQWPREDQCGDGVPPLDDVSAKGDRAACDRRPVSPPPRGFSPPSIRSDDTRAALAEGKKMIMYNIAAWQGGPGERDQFARDTVIVAAVGEVNRCWTTPNVQIFIDDLVTEEVRTRLVWKLAHLLMHPDAISYENNCGEPEPVPLPREDSPDAADYVSQQPMVTGCTRCTDPGCNQPPPPTDDDLPFIP